MNAFVWALALTRQHRAAHLLLKRANVWVHVVMHQ